MQGRTRVPRAVCCVLHLGVLIDSRYLQVVCSDGVLRMGLEHSHLQLLATQFELMAFVATHNALTLAECMLLCSQATVLTWPVQPSTMPLRILKTD